TGQDFFLNAGLTGSLVGPDFRFSRDESFAVWSSFFDENASSWSDRFVDFDIYAAPVQGGSAVLLNDPAAPPIQKFDVASDGRAVLQSHRRLVSAPLAGGPETSLNGPLVDGGGIDDFVVSPGGESVAYRARQDLPGASEIFVAPSLGGSPVKVSPPPRSNVGEVTRYEVGPNGVYAVFLADQETFGRPELWSVRLADGASVKLNPPLGEGEHLRDDFSFAKAGQRVIFTVEGPERLDLWSAPVGGEAAAIRLNAAEQPLDDPLHSAPFVSVPGGPWAVFYAEPSLYRVEVDGGAPALLTPGVEEIRSFGATPTGARVLFSSFSAQGESDLLLRSVSIAGGPTSTVAGPEPCAFSDFLFAPNSEWVTALCLFENNSEGRTLLAEISTGESLMDPGSEPTFTADSSNLIYKAPLGNLMRQPLIAGQPRVDVDFARIFKVRGGQIVYSTGPTLKALAIGASESVTLAEAPGGFPFIEELEISPDGKRVVFGIPLELGSDPDLFEVPSSGGVITPVATAVRDFSISPDSQRVFYQRPDSFAVIDLRNGHVQNLLPVGFDAEPLPPFASTPEGVVFRARSHGRLVELLISELELVFFDGFESGDTSAWTSTVP
ncbi:MAG: hypothetical protein AAFY88_11120, partial [Acidobacteriota bacterium]